MEVKVSINDGDISFLSLMYWSLRAGSPSCNMSSYLLLLISSNLDNKHACTNVVTLPYPVALIQHLWPYLKKGPEQLTSLSFIISLWARKMRGPLSTACWHIKMSNEKLSATVCMNPEFPSTSPVHSLLWPIRARWEVLLTDQFSDFHTQISPIYQPLVSCSPQTVSAESRHWLRVFGCFKF